MMAWLRRAAPAALFIGILYGLVYADLVLRARSAFLTGEQYWRWSEHPDQRLQMLEDRLAVEKRTLTVLRQQGKISDAVFSREQARMLFDHEQSLNESSSKYAYFWYQSAAELFAPPESRWVHAARVQMPLAKARWISELASSRIPFEAKLLD